MSEKPYLFAVYVAGLLVANVTGVKVMGIGPLLLSVGALAYPLTFVLQDVINELYGQKEAKVFVMASALSLLVLIVFCFGTVRIADVFSVEMTVAYSIVLGGSIRVAIASLSAFYIGGVVDVHVFFRARRRWPGSLFVRKVCSTLVSQCVDSFVFVFVAFFGVLPFDSLVVMWGSQYLVKQLIAFSGLPVTYFLIHRFSR